MENLRTFIRYNNAVPLFVALLAIVSGGAFAATTTGQETISQAVVGKQEKVISIDNTYIANIDLTNWTPEIQITSVKENEDNFFVTYNFHTIDLKDYRWQIVSKQETLKVDKVSLQEFKSLVDYVKYELAQKIDAEKERLVRTQEIEKKNVTQIQTVTTYTGLLGLVLDDTTKVEDPFQEPPRSEVTDVQPVPVNNPINTDVPVDNSTAATTTEPLLPTNTSTTTSTTTDPVVPVDNSTATTTTDTTTTTTTTSDPVVPTDTSTTTTTDPVDTNASTTSE